MIRLTAGMFLATFSFVAVAMADDPNPASLAPTPEQIALAKQLVIQLGSPVYRERDEATRELLKLGRVALGVIEVTINETPEPEIRERCEMLKPTIETADLNAKLKAFLADKDGQFTHDLPGWTKFQEITGNTTGARELFAELWKNKLNANLLTATKLSKEEFAKRVLMRRIDLYNTTMRFSPQGQRSPATLADVVTLLFAESFAGVSTERQYYYVVTNSLNLPNIRTALIDEKNGAPARKLLVNWMDSRTEMYEVYNTMTLAANLNLKEAPIAKYAEKVLELKTATGYYRMYALTTLARVGGKEHLGIMKKWLKDESVQKVVRFVNNVQQQTDVQVRDVALGMCLLSTEQKPEDYGFDVLYANANQNVAMKYSYNNYSFSSDEKRKAAFKKWEEYEAKPKKDEKK